MSKMGGISYSSLANKACNIRNINKKVYIQGVSKNVDPLK